MKTSLLVSLLFVSLSVFAQDTITLHHKAYSTTYSKSKCYPVKVEWWVTKNGLTCDIKVKRGDKFMPDPKLSKETNLQEHYVGTGFDRGHNFPAADAVCDQVANEESFYFSNMTAQYPALNRGDWKSLELYTRELTGKYDSVKVWCGSIGEERKVGIVSIPKQCWKVLYIKKTNEWIAYLFNNNTSKADGIANNKIDVAEITKLTGFQFK